MAVKMGEDDKKTEHDKIQGKVMHSAEAIDKKKPPNQMRLDRDTRARLGQHLRAMYDEVVSQGVPDRFSALLNRLDDKDTK